MTKEKNNKEELFPSTQSEYREPFMCPFHNCVTDNGWCWECAVETYGYDEARKVHDELTRKEG